MNENDSTKTLVVAFLASAIPAINNRDKSEQRFQLLAKLLDKHKIEYQEENWETLDTEFSIYLYFQLPPNANTTAIINDFLALPFVDAAYLKPGGTLPE